MSTTIKELVGIVAATGNVSKKTAEEQVSALFEKIGTELLAGNEVTVRDFGRFYGKQRPGRVARNPKTGLPVDVAAKTVIKFAPRGEFKEAI